MSGRPFRERVGEPAEQIQLCVGQQLARPTPSARQEWAAQHFRGVLSNFAVMGFSAGSLGTQSWAMSLLSAFSFRRGAVLLDSYAGLFPPSTQEAVIKEWGGCDTSLWPAAVRSMCHEGNLTVQYVGEETMRAFPDVAFGSIQSKARHARSSPVFCLWLPATAWLDSTPILSQTGFSQVWLDLDQSEATSTTFGRSWPDCLAVLVSACMKGARPVVTASELRCGPNSAIIRRERASMVISPENPPTLLKPDALKHVLHEYPCGARWVSRKSSRTTLAEYFSALPPDCEKCPSHLFSIVAEFE